MVSFYALPVIFIDTVTANRYERKPTSLSCKKVSNVFFEEGTLIKRAGVRTPWTPPGSTPALP